nr:MAG TPA: hypothetical protein [Caudoviricetes sp.]
MPNSMNKDRVVLFPIGCCKNPSVSSTLSMDITKLDLNVDI